VRQPPGPRPGRDDHAVGPDLLAVPQHDAAVARVEPGGRGAEPPPHVQVLVGVGQRQVGLRAGPGQERLRQGRAVVGLVRLGADADDLALEGLPAQGPRGGDARQGGADDRDPLHHATAFPVVEHETAREVRNTLPDGGRRIVKGPSCLLLRNEQPS
jgi:hypothetical protein